MRSQVVALLIRVMRWNLFPQHRLQALTAIHTVITQEIEHPRGHHGLTSVISIRCLLVRNRFSFLLTSKKV